MNRSMRTGLAAAAGLAMSFGGLSVATAAEPTPPPEPKPGKTVTFKVDDTLVWPKNHACNVAVEIQNKATISISITSDGRFVTTLAPDGKTRIKNTKTGKSYSFKNDGGFVDQVLKNGNWKSYGFGRNLYFGKGIKGLLYTNGEQYFKVYNPDDPNKVKIKMRHIEGKQTQLCYKIGAKPVPGKNPKFEEPKPTEAPTKAYRRS